MQITMLKNIGQRIKEAREELNVSQKDLGMSLGLSDKAISAYEANRTIPPLETLVRIAQELHKPLDYFIQSDSNTFRIESQLSKIENILTQFLFEIAHIRKQLDLPRKEGPIDPNARLLATDESPIEATTSPHSPKEDEEVVDAIEQEIETLLTEEDDEESPQTN